MSVQTALREFRQEHGLSQAAVARMALMSESAIAKAEEGIRSLPHDAIARLVDQTGDPRLAMEAVKEVTGGAFASPYLDGEHVDLHRTAVMAKLHEELKEALRYIEEADLANKPRQDEYTRRCVKELLFQMVDVRVAVDHFIMVLAPQCGLRVSEIFAEHERKLRDRGYIKCR